MLFIAEIGLNHNGNFDLGCEMIRQAKLAGADIAKFQLGWRDKPGEINRLDARHDSTNLAPDHARVGVGASAG